ASGIRGWVLSGRLAHARRAGEAARRVSALSARVTRSTAARLEAPRLLLVLGPGQLRLQPPDVMLGRLVVRRLLDLVLDGLNLFVDRHLTKAQSSGEQKDSFLNSATTPCECLPARGPSPHTRPSATSATCRATSRGRRARGGRTDRRRRASP